MLLWHQIISRCMCCGCCPLPTLPLRVSPALPFSLRFPIPLGVRLESRPGLQEEAIPRPEESARHPPTLLLVAVFRLKISWKEAEIFSSKWSKHALLSSSIDRGARLSLVCEIFSRSCKKRARYPSSNLRAHSTWRRVSTPLGPTAASGCCTHTHARTHAHARCCGARASVEQSAPDCDRRDTNFFICGRPR